MLPPIKAANDHFSNIADPTANWATQNGFLEKGEVNIINLTDNSRKKYKH